MAVNRNFKDDKGNQQADFINCVAWRGQAENMAKFLKKGALIGVEGRIETGSYDDHGMTRYTTQILANAITFLETKKGQNQTSQAPSSQQQTSQQEMGCFPVTHLILSPLISIHMILISQIRMLPQIIIIHLIQRPHEQGR